MFIFIYLVFERVGETEHEQGRGRESGRQRIWSRLQVLSCQHRAPLRAWTQEWWDHDLDQNRTLNWLSHLGTPKIFFNLPLKKKKKSTTFKSVVISSPRVILLTFGLYSFSFPMCIFYQNKRILMFSLINCPRQLSV